MHSILLVEDNLSILEMLRAVFLSRGVEVFTATDGITAFTTIKEMEPDIIILDVILPGMDGITLLQKIREEKISTPVIMLTDQSLIDDKVKGLNCGADDYITKPFSTRELIARVNAQLRRLELLTASPEEQMYSIGNIEISTDAREVHMKSGELVKLTKTEFDLVLYLVKTSPRIVEQGELLQNVLDYQYNTETKALVMHIANLRRKLNHAGNPGFKISAVAGVGYRLLIEED